VRADKKISRSGSRSDNELASCGIVARLRPSLGFGEVTPANSTAQE
jgi:hypothetical protein